MIVANVVDGVLEATVVGSFTSLGYEVRRRTAGWSDDEIAVDGRRVLVTGGTSGVGRAAATELARRGAHVTITGRDGARTERAALAIAAEAGNGSVVAEACDLASLEQTRALAARLVAAGDGLDVLVHNAGALDAEFARTEDGIETTFQVHVVAPALLTAALLPLLRNSEDGRVIWVTSGGMYSERLDVDTVELGEEGYDGTKAYARAKRAQVELAPRYAERLASSGVTVHTMHPGWADTPGVERSLPRFHTLLGPALRTPAQGADTVVWLAGAPVEVIGSGKLWLDRRERSRHKGPWSRTDDPEAEVDRLWALVAQRAGLDDLVS